MNSAATRLPRATAEQLSRLAPLDTLSPDRLNEVAAVAALERAARGSDPLAAHRGDAQSVFLLQGEMLLVFEKGGTMVIVGGTEDARHVLNRRDAPLMRTKAITDVELLVVDSDMLDFLATWDGVAAAAAGGSESALAIAIASAALRGGVLAQLPSAHIDELMTRFARVKVRRGEVVIREGDEGDSYYVIASGRFQVERMIGGVKVVLAELKPFDAFGEEALVSEAKRNATVVATSDAELLKLGKLDFDQLLREPLLRRVRFDEARSRVRDGALWLDVRYPSEYQYDKLPGAINVPLSEVRNMFAVLDRSRDYVVYCQSGRRSAAAAFLFAQQGFRVWLLEGGLWGAEKRD
ncbi:MAG TPA: cyclic nucleotide-binding domain-containing protein [Burkholderiales bacterium]|nr:cyclic nucleotide-binding domain-containing protein [Burkholderiales bacterium]